jgi:hypothetical protein
LSEKELVEKYEVTRNKNETAQDFNKRQAKKIRQFKLDLAESLGVPDNMYRDAIMDKAYMEGKDTFRSIILHAESLVAFLIKIDYL